MVRRALRAVVVGLVVTATLLVTLIAGPAEDGDRPATSTPATSAP
ncbi:MAG: hypothetical protein AAGF02_13135 [Actinomycetota bacterium]